MGDRGWGVRMVDGEQGVMDRRWAEMGDGDGVFMFLLQ